MVLSVCERLLPCAQDAEDAFQATFFTLARKAASIGRREAVGSWLYRVAYRIGLRARALAATRGRHERPLGELGAAEPAYDPPDELGWRELRPVLDAEVSRLPEKYRAAFVLCYLEGKTNEEAAALLDCPKGTILSRLSRARERLRDALARRGLSFAAEPLASLLRQHASTLGALSPLLVNGVVQTGALLAVQKAAEGHVAPHIAALMEGAAAGAARGRLRHIAAVLVALGLIGTAGGVYAYTSALAAAPAARSGCSGVVAPAPPAAGGGDAEPTPCPNRDAPPAPLGLGARGSAVP
jgi:RNA polymerase sigma factor (sigma-70 family)